jgi:Ca2+-transporting ATPase
VSRSAVVAVAAGQWQVRGLLGNPSLAAWLQAGVRRDLGLAVRASAATGRVRAARLPEAEAARVTAVLEASVRRYDPLPAVAPRVVAPTVPKAASRRLPARPAQPAASAAVAAGRAKRLHDDHAMPLADLLRRLGAAEAGLPAAEAAARLRRHGANRLSEIAARGDLEILLAQFGSLPVGLLAGAGVMALASRAWLDAGAIASVLAANAGIGFVTEREADRTVNSLSRLAPARARVLRDGVECEVPADDVVPGDVLLLAPGDAIAADARVLVSHRLSVNEAALTGESLPVRKEPVPRLPRDLPLGERRNMLFMGTVVSGGTGRAVVVATAHGTALGAIRALAEGAAAPRTRLQSQLDRLGRDLGLGTAALAALVFAAGLLRGRPALPLLRATISLAVAAIPEGLPAVATSLLAAGIRRMKASGVFARNLDAVENLGALDVVCLDKTGTLTENRMRVAAVSFGAQRIEVGSTAAAALRALPADWLRAAALCNEAEPGADGGGSATERALLELIGLAGGNVAALRRAHPRLALKQRSEHHPYMVTLHADGRRGAFVAVKGRPQEVLARCTAWHDGRSVRPLDARSRAALLRENDRLAGLGLRVLALACRRQPARRLGETGGLVWLGMVGLSDPIRAGVPEVIARFRRAGVRPLMLTGDQLGTARAVARGIGLDPGPRVVDAAGLPEHADPLSAVVDDAAAFARATPAMKLELVRALQARGHVVAMTGDGINDGPALKTADVGFAMGASGTDFAHAMSDLVLHHDHPAGILDAIAEGRTAYLNVKKAVRYLLATNLSELAVAGTATLVGLPEPFDPLGLLWVNIATDVSPAIALGLEPAEPDIMERPPFGRGAALLDRAEWRRLGIDGGAIAAATLAAFVFGVSRYGEGPRARTLALNTLTVGQLLHAFSARSEARLAQVGAFGNRRLNLAVGATLALQAGTILVPPLRRLLRNAPLGPLDWPVSLALAALPTLLRELRKPAIRDPGARS